MKSFFTFEPLDSKAIVLDTEVLDALTWEEIKALSPNEQRFVMVYRRMKRDGLHSAKFLGPATIQDRPQAEICREILKMFDAPTDSDPDIF